MRRRAVSFSLTGTARRLLGLVYRQLMVDRVEGGGGLSQVTPKSEDDRIVAGGGWTTRTVIVERRERRPRADAWRRLMVLLAPFTVVSVGLALATLIIGDDHGRLTLFGLSAWGLVATAGGLLAAQLDATVRRP